jgi:hypothetical protein
VIFVGFWLMKITDFPIVNWREAVPGTFVGSLGIGSQLDETWVEGLPHQRAWGQLVRIIGPSPQRILNNS